MDIETEQSISEARKNDPENPPDWPDPPEDPTPQPQPPMQPGLEVIARKPAEIVLRWRDNSDNESNNYLEKTDSIGGVWSTAANLGAPYLGTFEYRDYIVAPDFMYCYRIKTTNPQGTRYSPTKCPWTTASASRGVGRLQLRVGVADVEDAGTDDGMHVRLNAMPGFEIPYANHTFMDYGHDDFERNTTFTYDLDMAGVSDMADINRIDLYKDGEDGVCLREFALLVNGVEVFTRTFGNTSSSCHWLDYGGGHQTAFLVGRNELRASSGWINYVAPGVQVNMLRPELESRFEALLGNAIAGTGIQYGHLYGRAVEVWHTNLSTFHVDFDLEASINNLPNPEVDIDLDLQVQFVPSTTSPGTWELTLTTVNSTVNVDYPWYWELVSYITTPLCSPIATIATADMVWECSSSIEGYLENRVENALQPIEKAFNVGSPCPAPLHPAASVGGDGRLNFGCEP